MKENNISVVIPICSPKKEFISVIERLIKQTVTPKEIILINSKSYFDASELIIEEIEDKFEACGVPIVVHTIEKNEFDHGGTRHFGIEKSAGEYILMMTQDAVPKNKYLIENLLAHFEQNDVAVAYARQIPRKSSDIIESYIRKFNYGKDDLIKTEADIEKMGIKAFFSSDVCAMYSKEKYYAAGGFPIKTIFNEDSIYAYKALVSGYKVVYASKAIVFHSHKYTILQDFKRNFDLGVSQKQYAFIFDRVSSENEGVKLVKDTAEHLIKNDKWYLLPSLIAHSGIKYLGYQFGKHYTLLPKKMVSMCSMNENYWKRGN
ncbi:MAG: glycosyltransferase family 2 protein [Lachnospiraceae bacterium]|nr:glycosyltransferase family 2 protein [Lachnospiraceae bacterium]